jgi:hypothetical protein
MAKDSESYTDKEATARFEAELKSAMKTSHKPLKEKPKAGFKSIQIPGSSAPVVKRGPKPKGERASTGAERMAKGRAELKASRASSHHELVRESKLAPTAADTKKKPGK